MGYIEDNLISGESVVYTTTRSIGFYIFLGLPLLLFVEMISALIIFGVPYALFCYLDKKYSEFAITNKRVILKTGFIMRATVEILLTKCEGLSTEEPLFMRPFNAGNIITGGTGGSKQRFLFVNNPEEF